MAKTYTAAGTVVAGDVATAAAFNVVTSDINNLIVPPAVSVYRTSNLTSYTSGLAITWQAEHYDTDDMWTSGTGITINTTGLYLVNFMGQLTCSAGLVIAVPEIVRSTVNILSGFQPLNVGGSEVRACLSGVIDCTAGDSISARASISGGSSHLWAGGATYGEAQLRLSLTWIGKKSLT